MVLGELLSRWSYRIFAPGTLLRQKYNAFRELLELDVCSLELLASLEEIHSGADAADWNRVVRLCRELEECVQGMAELLHTLDPIRGMGLEEYVKKIGFYVRLGLDIGHPGIAAPYCLSFKEAVDTPALAGGKAASLAMLHARTELPVPPGFVVTTTAANYFMDVNDLREPISEILSRIHLNDREALLNGCAEMEDLIRAASVPEEIVREMEAHLSSLPDTLLAVRSSAVAEDGESSFAGIYQSRINVKPEDMVTAYREVLLGKYTPRAITYRILKGLSDEETSMAVMIQPMIQPVASGVMYTTDEDPTQCVQGVTSVYSVRGLGESLVSGQSKPDVFCLTKEDTPHILHKPHHFDTPPLKAVLRLSHIARELESFFESPQDVEWALDNEENLHILQSRPLHSQTMVRDLPPAPPIDTLPLIAEGLRVSQGVCSGTIIRSDAAPGKPLEHGTILVTASLAPSLVRHMDTLAGVIARTGSRAGHFASVAREFGLPVMVTEETDALEDGMEVTMSADTGQVYPGRIDALLQAPRLGNQHQETPAGKRLASIMHHLSPLSLTDPDAENFTPEGCKSMHDVVRFAHEVAVNGMFTLVERSGRGLGRVKKLNTKLPIVLYVLDLGGGLFSSVREEKTITPEDVVSKPMWAVWWGLSKSGATWSQALQHVDWEELDRISAGIFSKDSKILASYAIVAQDYTHLMLRFGYHFAVLDSICGNDSTNHIAFRFKGGGGEWEQRTNRLVFLRKALEAKGFTVRIRGDMLDAHFGHGTENQTRQRLVFLGRIMAHSRMLDLKLSSREAALELAEQFISLDEADNG